MFNMLVPFLHMKIGPSELFVAAVLYAYTSYTQMVLARRLGILPRDAWLAWLPFANIYLLTKMAGLEWWYMLGVFIPYLNYALVAILWSQIGTRLKKPFWVGLFVVMPYIGVFVPGYFVLDTKNRI